VSASQSDDSGELLQRELRDTYRAEAAALFTANQNTREAAERTAFFVLTIIGAAAATGISAHSSLVALALSPLTLMLMSYMCQQYVEVTVLGAARARLEDELANTLPARGLIYERAVSPVRHGKPFSTSIRILNASTIIVVIGAVAAGIVVAIEGQAWYWEVAFGASTFLSAVSAAASFWDMHRASRDASRLIDDQLQVVAPD
jgi:hypothetical protein